jgi:hypothetical protein
MRNIDAYRRIMVKWTLDNGNWIELIQDNSLMAAFWDNIDATSTSSKHGIIGF